MSFIALGVTGTVTAATAIAGASALAGAGMGAASMINASKQQKKAQNALEAQAKNSPLYKPDKSIDTYYQEAMNRYKENPYQSQAYLISKQEADRRLMAGITGLQDRRSAIGGISKLDLMRTDAQNQAIRNAEMMKGQNLSRLGQATQLKSGDYQRQFDINKMTPYNRQLQLEQMKAQAAGERYNAGMQMVGQGVSNIGSLAGAGAFKGVGGGANTNAVNTDLGFGGTIGSPSGKFTDSPKIDYSLYWKPTKTF